MRLETEFQEPNDNPGFLLWRVTNAWQREIRSALEPLNLTHVQFVLLASLAWLGERGQNISQVQLARHSSTDVMMVSDVLRALEGKGFIQRGPHPSDARAKVLHMTPEGLALINQAVVRVEAVDKAYFGRLENVTALSEHLKKLLGPS